MIGPLDGSAIGQRIADGYSQLYYVSASLYYRQHHLSGGIQPWETYGQESYQASALL